MIYIYDRYVYIYYMIYIYMLAPPKPTFACLLLSLRVIFVLRQSRGDRRNLMVLQERRL